VNHPVAQRRRIRIRRFDAGNHVIAEHGCATEEEAVSFLRLVVGHPFGGYLDGKLLEEADPMMIVHLPPPPGGEQQHTLIVDLEADEVNDVS
jgi:hypothetical protein